MVRHDPAPMVTALRELPELGWGSWTLLDTDQPSVLAHRCDWRGQGVLVLHNLGPEAIQVAVELDGAKPGHPVAEVLANRRHDPVEAGRPLDLDGYGYRWLRLLPAEPSYRRRARTAGGVGASGSGEGGLTSSRRR